MADIKNKKDLELLVRDIRENEIKLRVELAAKHDRLVNVRSKILKKERMKKEQEVDIQELEKELLLREVKKKQLMTKSQLTVKERELNNIKLKISRKETETVKQTYVIQLLREELKVASTLPIPRQVRLTDVLRLQFKKETANSSNYPSCLRLFLQSGYIEKVEAIDEEIILTFFSSSKLEKLLTYNCLKTVRSWKQISSLTRRAAMVRRKDYEDFGLLVYLEETSLLAKSIKHVDDELRAGQAKVEYRTFGFSARYPTLLSYMRAMTNRELYSNHKVLFMKENLSFMGGSGEQFKFFNGRVCLPERDFLRLQWKTEENTSSKSISRLLRYVNGLSSFLKNSSIEQVTLDWNNKIVIMFATQLDFETQLKAYCTTDKTNSLSKLASLPDLFTYASVGTLYSVQCIQNVDVREFFQVDDTCQISPNSDIISSHNRSFPFSCLTNPCLRAAYPDIILHSADFVEL